jgi:hypothetical protein
MPPIATSPHEPTPVPTQLQNYKLMERRFSLARTPPRSIGSQTDMRQRERSTSNESEQFAPQSISPPQVKFVLGASPNTKQASFISNRNSIAIMPRNNSIQSISEQENIFNNKIDINKFVLDLNLTKQQQQQYQQQPQPQNQQFIFNSDDLEEETILDVSLKEIILNCIIKLILFFDGRKVH